MPIEQASVTVKAPDAATKVVCYRGGYGQHRDLPGTAGASQLRDRDAEPGEGMTVLLRLPDRHVQRHRADPASTTGDRPGAAGRVAVSPWGLRAAGCSRSVG